MGKNGGLTSLGSVPTVPPLELLDFIGFVHTPLYKNKEFLQQKYADEGLSLAQIAEQICSSKEAVRCGLERFGITAREAHKPHGRPSQCRFGQKIRTGQAGPHHAEQRVIDVVKNLKSQGLSLRQIASALTQLKIPTKNRGKSWHPEMVSRVLSQ